MNVFGRKRTEEFAISGITFPPGGFADAIAGALRREYGATHAAVKIVVDLTGANERAVKNWFDASRQSGRRADSSEHGHVSGRGRCHRHAEQRPVASHGVAR